MSRRSATLTLSLASTLLGWSSAAASINAQQAPPNAYVGEMTCVMCHEQTYAGTAHSLESNQRTPAANMGCESCHGPGKAHVDAGGDPSLIVRFAASAMRPQEASAVCVTCHDRGTHALWTGSQHDQRNVGCVTCHSVHSST